MLLSRRVALLKDAVTFVSYISHFVITKRKTLRTNEHKIQNQTTKELIQSMRNMTQFLLTVDIENKQNTKIV